jgi:hypothetical protein
MWFIVLSFIWLNNFEVFGCRKSTSLSKIFTSPPLGLCPWGWLHHYIHLPQLYHCTQIWQEQCKLSNGLMLNSVAVISKACRYSHQWLWRLLCCLMTCDTMLLGGQVPPKCFLFPTTKYNNQQKYQSDHLLSPQFIFSKNKTT